MKLVYIAGPYRGKDITEVRKNIAAAKRTGIDLIAAMEKHVAETKSRRWKSVDIAAPIIPHMNTALFDFQGQIENVPAAYYLDATMQMMLACHAVILVSRDAPMQSVGTNLECVRANEEGIPVFTSVPAYILYVKDPVFRGMVNLQVRQTKEILSKSTSYELVTFGE